MLKLTELKAENAGITDLSGLEHAKKLEILYLAHNSITDISPLLKLPKIRWVDVRDNSITRIPELNWPRLKSLIIYHNPLGDLDALSDRFAARQEWVILYEGNRHPDLRPPPKPKATTENNEMVDVPQAVWNKMCDYTLEAFQANFYETLKAKRFADCFGPVSRRQMPHGKHFHLYTHCCPITYMHSFTAILAYDSQNKRVGARMTSLSDEDIYLIKGPRIFFQDLDLDGCPELVTQDADHFGTNADHVHTTYWHMNNGLSFEPILRLRTYDTTDIPIPPRKSDEGKSCYHCTVATVETVEPNAIVVSTGIALNDRQKQRRLEQTIGSVVFKMDKASLTFKPTKETVFLKEHTKALRRTNLLEFRYTCSNPACGKRTETRDYSGKRVNCPPCGGWQNYTGTVIRSHH